MNKFIVKFVLLVMFIGALIQPIGFFEGVSGPDFLMISNPMEAAIKCGLFSLIILLPLKVFMWLLNSSRNG